MKKISTVLMVAGLTSFVFAQKGNAFSDSFNSNNQTPAGEAAAEGPGGGGLGGSDPEAAPIDDYIPLLAAAGVGLAVYFGRKKYMLTK